MRMEAMEEKSSTLLVKDARIFVTVVMQEGHWTKVGCRGDCSGSFSFFFWVVVPERADTGRE